MASREENERDTKMSTGFVLYEGKSALPGQEDRDIVAILVKENSNEKMGGADVAQVYILSQEDKPQELVNSGKDDSICGDCPFRAGQGCYVIPFQGPGAVYRAWLRGKAYEHGIDNAKTWLRAHPRKIRLGAYGDPAAVPQHVWQALLTADIIAMGLLGYTRQWNKPQFQFLRSYCMASIMNLVEFAAAQAMGWNTFRSRHDSDGKLPCEIQCPADKVVYGKNPPSKCVKCGICMGNLYFRKEGKKKVGVSIVVHGRSKNRARNLVS